MARPLVLAALLCAVALNAAAVLASLVALPSLLVGALCFVTAVVAAVGAGLLAGVR